VALVGLFVEEPSRTVSLLDVADAPGTTLAAAIEEISNPGFRRHEYLLTYMRAESWRWLVGSGIGRVPVEPLLGIMDRSNFRRGCRRARVRVPWSGR
jgi:hypothetical protein